MSNVMTGLCHFWHDKLTPPPPHLASTQVKTMGNFVHTAFKAYCGVLLGPV